MLTTCKISKLEQFKGAFLSKFEKTDVDIKENCFFKPKSKTKIQTPTALSQTPSEPTIQRKDFIFETQLTQIWGLM